MDQGFIQIQDQSFAFGVARLSGEEEGGAGGDALVQGGKTFDEEVGVELPFLFFFLLLLLGWWGLRGGRGRWERDQYLLLLLWWL